MAKRKADSEPHAPSLNGSKKAKLEIKPNFLDDDSDSDDSSTGGAKLEEPEFKVNEEYAKRFAHNKKREELQRLEEKYQKTAKPVRGQYGDKYDEDSETSSTDEDEDDDGFLATEALDAEISATLQAIRTKDPRVYDDKSTFYAPIEEGEGEGETTERAKKEKPVHLSDYHRENLLRIANGEEEEEVPQTFAQEQEALKKTIVREMHAADESSGEADEDGGFLIPKSKPKMKSTDIHPSRAAQVKKSILESDVAAADKDPETFLSNFIAARAWVPGGRARFQPMESDDEEEDDRADKFESAYNLRFEDPKNSNETLRTFARDVIAAKSVRREEPNTRKKQRDAEREKKDAKRKEREEERAQLRRLKIEEMEEKLQKIKKAAGINGKVLKDEDWTQFLEGGWEGDEWEEEMNKRFGADYYAAPEGGSDSEEGEGEDGASKKKKKPKKPKWDDDIDIKDLIPEFNDDEDNEKPAFSLSDSENASGDEADQISKKSSKSHKEDRQAKAKAARIERKKIEQLVDNNMDVDLPTNSKQPTRFRYRETSPTTFGLTARDILMAPDSQLNQFAGLKKMAPFRDAEKKRKDKKHLGKKARLRLWRKETFGNEDGPEIIIGADAVEGSSEVGTLVEKKKKKRSKKGKGVAA